MKEFIRCEDCSYVDTEKCIKCMPEDLIAIDDTDNIVGCTTGNNK